MKNRAIGAYGEYLAEEYLKKKKYKILAKNCNFCGQELDIVAVYTKKAQAKQIKEEYKKSEIKSKTALKCRLTALEDILVFVEVKYSSSRYFGEPAERVSLLKQKHIIKAAEGFMYKNRIAMPCRFDVISIVGKEINHIEDAFSVS